MNLRKISPCDSDQRVPSSSGVMLLGEGCGETLPTLRRIRSSYMVETDGDRLHRFCIALLERGFGDHSLWKKAGENPAVFTKALIQGLINQLCGNALDESVEYTCELTTDVNLFPYRRKPVQQESLFAMFHLARYGYVRVGAALKALEAEEPYLGAAFYFLMLRSAHQWFRVYDHRDAEWYLEEMHEWADQEDPEDRESYEFPPVEEAIPEPIRLARSWKDSCAVGLLRKQAKGPYSTWIEKVLTLYRLSRLKRETFRFEGEYEAPAGPSWLVVFKQGDAIEACFDQQLELYYETDHEPTCAVSFRPENKAEFDSALHTMTVFLKINKVFAELVSLLNIWEDQHGSERERRAAPPLQVD